MTIKKNDPIAARLCEQFGCSACKAQVTEDEFLLQHERYWCQKRKQSFSKDAKAHVDCPSWTFSGAEDLLKSMFSNQEPLPFDDEPPRAK